jgi:probable FeS assembly SUF system protein SufT
VTTEKPITLFRDCSAIMVPSGEQITLRAGSQVWLTQSLGGSYTVMTDRGYPVRIDGRDADALGMAPAPDQLKPASGQSGSIQDQVWNQLRSCFDPEIPVNIVDLGLIYDCRVSELAGGGHRAEVRFTLTARGCGMGQFLKEDIKRKLLTLPGMKDADVELVWDPPWNQSMISEEGKHRLGIE